MKEGAKLMSTPARSAEAAAAKAKAPRSSAAATGKKKSARQPKRTGDKSGTGRPAPAKGAEVGLPADERQREVIRVADALFAQDPDWVSFFREIYGTGGIIQQLYKEAKQQAEFDKSPANVYLQSLIKRLRERRPDPSYETEPQRMITIRLPASMHDALKAEATSRLTTMNQLCISKLLQVIDSDHVPVTRKPKGEKSRRRRDQP